MRWVRVGTDASGSNECEAERWFLGADGESGKRYGNETIRVTPEGQVSIKLPAPLAHLANSLHGRYALTATVAFAHRGGEWADRVEGNRAVAHRIHDDTGRDRWYLTSANPTASRTTSAEPPHTVTCSSATPSPRLLHWARQTRVTAIAIEDLDFSAEKTREKHGRRKRFRQLISGMPTGKLKARLVSMAAEHGLPIIAVDPAYTSRWGAQHWQKPLATPHRKMSRHDAAGIAIGRRALGHPIRRRTTPPPHDRSGRAGHRTVQTASGARGREGTRPPATDHAPGGAPPSGMRKRRPSASNTVRDAPRTHQWVQDSLMHTG